MEQAKEELYNYYSQQKKYMSQNQNQNLPAKSYVNLTYDFKPSNDDKVNCA